MVVTGLKGNQYQEQSARKLGFALFFIYLRAASKILLV